MLSLFFVYKQNTLTLREGWWLWALLGWNEQLAQIGGELIVWCGFVPESSAGEDDGNFGGWTNAVSSAISPFPEVNWK